MGWRQIQCYQCGTKPDSASDYVSFWFQLIARKRLKVCWDCSAVVVELDRCEPVV